MNGTIRHNASPSAAPLQGAGFALAFVLLFAVAILPVLFTETLPLLDYPNHLARMHILSDWDSSAILQRFYLVTWRPIPDLAMDLAVPALAKFMPLAWAGKIFVIATMFLLVFGVALLHRVLVGAWSLWSCVAFLLLYNRFLLWGFINFLFGAGLAVTALAIWIALARRPLGLRLAVGLVLAFLVYFSHLLAFGLFGVMVAGYELGRFWREGALARGFVALILVALAFLPPLLLLIVASPDTAGGAISYGHFWRKFDLLFSVFDNYNRPFDIACFLLAAVAIGFAFWRRWLRLTPEIVVPLILLAIVFLALPSRLFTASGADHRVPLVLALVLIAGSGWNPRFPLYGRLFLSGALALFLIRLGLVMASWQSSDGYYASILPALDRLPVGARLAVAYAPGAVHVDATPLAHIAGLAVIRRDAFVPTLFADPAQQPLLLQPEYRTLARNAAPEALWNGFVLGGKRSDRVVEALKSYDFILFVDSKPFSLADKAGLAPIFAAPRFELYRLTQDSFAP